MNAINKVVSAYTYLWQTNQKFISPQIRNTNTQIRNKYYICVLADNLDRYEYLTIPLKLKELIVNPLFQREFKHYEIYKDLFWAESSTK